jgi:nucleoside-diphosphate-sugar epimerase
MAADDGRVVPALINAALAGEPLPIHGDGEQTRSFCYVSDLVDVLLLVAFDRDAAGQIFNIGNPEEVSMLELVSAVLDATGANVRVSFLPPVADDPARRKPDIRRVQNRYDWRPRVALAEGLRHTAAYFRTLREESLLAEAA